MGRGINSGAALSQHIVEDVMLASIAVSRHLVLFAKFFITRRQ
jgi:hypothetical protein